MIKRLLILVVLLGGFFLLTDKEEKDGTILNEIVKEGIEEEGSDSTEEVSQDEIGESNSEDKKSEVVAKKESVVADAAETETEVEVVEGAELCTVKSCDEADKVEEEKLALEVAPTKSVTTTQIEVVAPVVTKAAVVAPAEKPAEINVEYADPAVGVYKGKEIETVVLENNGTGESLEISTEVENVDEQNSGRTTNVKVYMYDNGIDFSQKTIPSGTVIFDVFNNSPRFSHTFVVDGVNYGKIEAGTGNTIVIPMTAGTYDIYSDKRNDAQFIFDQVIVK